jgi:cell division protein FtsB
MDSNHKLYREIFSGRIVSYTDEQIQTLREIIQDNDLGLEQITIEDYINYGEMPKVSKENEYLKTQVKNLKELKAKYEEACQHAKSLNEENYNHNDWWKAHCYKMSRLQYLLKAIDDIVI